MQSWVQDNVNSNDELADNVTDAQTQYDKFKRDYFEQLEKQDELMKCGCDANCQIDELDEEIFGHKKQGDSHFQLSAAVVQLSNAKGKMTDKLGNHLKILEECVEYHLLHCRFHNLVNSLNQLNSSVTHSLKICLKFEDVAAMGEMSKDVDQKLQVWNHF